MVFIPKPNILSPSVIKLEKRMSNELKTVTAELQFDT